MCCHSHLVHYRSRMLEAIQEVASWNFIALFSSIDMSSSSYTIRSPPAPAMTGMRALADVGLATAAAPLVSPSLVEVEGAAAGLAE
mmetsp:Transcript_31867/g.83190  ORF Transcript_31867/g.83190 Transcript_31867/m.83190 type:complete len:86 (-) Transcript_31867:989-1246(-)